MPETRDAHRAGERTLRALVENQVLRDGAYDVGPFHATREFAIEALDAAKAWVEETITAHGAEDATNPRMNWQAEITPGTYQGDQFDSAEFGTIRDAVWTEDTGTQLHWAQLMASGAIEWDVDDV